MGKPWNTSAEREDYICNFVKRMIDSSESATMLDRQRWLANYQFFLGEPEINADRAQNTWMSQPYLPEYISLIRRIASVIQDLIFEDDSFFELDTDTERGGKEELTRVLRSIVEYVFTKDIKLANKTYEYCLDGGLYGIAVAKFGVSPKIEYTPETVIEAIEDQELTDQKSIPKDVENVDFYAIPTSPDLMEGQMNTVFSKLFGSATKPQRRTLKPMKRIRMGNELALVNPLQFFFDPNVSNVNDSSWCAERGFCYFYDLQPKFETGEFKKQKKDEVLSTQPYHGGTMSGVASSYDEYKIKVQRQFSELDKGLPINEVIEYWGDLYDLTTGEILEENKVFVVVNDKVLVKDKVNPYFSQKSPYYCSVFSPIPHKAVGAGVGDCEKQLNELVNELMAMWIDELRLAIYQPMAFDSTKLSNDTEVDRYVTPGALYDTAGAKPQEVFSPIPVNLNVGPPLFQTLEMLKMSGEKGASVDTSSSNPASRSRISATEVQSNLNRSTQSVLTLGRQLDDYFIIPTVERLIDSILQFGFEIDVLKDFRDMGVISESEFQMVSQIPKIERYNELRRNYKIKIKGFRSRLENQEFLKKLNEAIMVISKLPPDQVAKIQWGELLKRYLAAFGFDVDKLIAQATPQDKAREENAILSNKQTVSVGPTDDDAAELPVHYEFIMQSGPSPQSMSHIVQHIQRASAQGKQFPPPPPPIAKELGMTGPGQAPGQGGPGGPPPGGSPTPGQPQGSQPVGPPPGAGGPPQGGMMQ